MPRTRTRTSIRTRTLGALALLLASAMLSACAGGAGPRDAAGGASGVTVYGTVDGGIGRTAR
jgi:hypothetical protein